MPAYEICYLDTDGALTYKFAADCTDDSRAKVLAHAMKLPSAKRLEVWSGENADLCATVRQSCAAGADAAGLLDQRFSFGPGQRPGQRPFQPVETIHRSPLR